MVDGVAYVGVASADARVSRIASVSARLSMRFLRIVLLFI